jgi:hypothetical protein
MKRALCLLVLALVLPATAKSDEECENRCQEVYDGWVETCGASECFAAATCQYQICTGGCNGGIRETPEACRED